MDAIILNGNIGWKQLSKLNLHPQTLEAPWANWKRCSVRAVSLPSTCQMGFSAIYCSIYRAWPATAVGISAAKFLPSCYLANKSLLEQGYCTCSHLASVRFCFERRSSNASCTSRTAQPAAMWVSCVRYRCEWLNQGIFDLKLRTFWVLDYSRPLLLTTISLWKIKTIINKISNK